MVLLEGPGVQQVQEVQAPGPHPQQQQVAGRRRRVGWTSDLGRGWGGAQQAARTARGRPVKVSLGLGVMCECVCWDGCPLVVLMVVVPPGHKGHTPAEGAFIGAHASFCSVTARLSPVSHLALTCCSPACHLCVHALQVRWAPRSQRSTKNTRNTKSTKSTASGRAPPAADLRTPPAPPGARP
jgi:hypothetical protein